MKLIIAYIQPERLNSVKKALFAREVSSFPLPTRWVVASRRDTSPNTVAPSKR